MKGIFDCNSKDGHFRLQLEKTPAMKAAKS